MTVFVFALLLMQQQTVPTLPLNATPIQRPQQQLPKRSIEPTSAYGFLDRGEMPAGPSPHNRDQSLIQYTLRVIAQACKKSNDPTYSCSCVPTGSPFGDGLTALEAAADPGETTFTRVVGFHAIAIAARNGCRDESLARAVLIGLHSEPPEDVCTPTIVGDFAAGAVTELPCSVFNFSANIVEAASIAAVYFGRPGSAFESGAATSWRQFKTALEEIAADTDEKRHGATIAAAKEALSKLGYTENK